MESNREDLISKLATSMGIHNYERIRGGNSYYDPCTGTLYCKGKAITNDVAEQAVRHFEIMESKCDIGNPDERQMALIYRCAIEAIKVIKNPEIVAYIKQRYMEGI